MRISNIALPLALGACAAPAGYWNHPTADAAQKDRDARQCIYEAAAATSGAPASFSLSQNVSQDIATGVRRAELEKLCIQAKGYYWVPR